MNIFKDFSLHLLLCILVIETGFIAVENLPADPKVIQAAKGLVNSSLSFIITNFIMKVWELFKANKIEIEKLEEPKEEPKEKKKKKKKKGKTDKL